MYSSIKNQTGCTKGRYGCVLDRICFIKHLLTMLSNFAMTSVIDESSEIKLSTGMRWMERDSTSWNLAHSID